MAEKLQRAVTDVADPAEAAWIEARLRPLAGIGDESELGGDRRSETFAAWRRYLEELAGQRPLVLIFEDLQWADDGLLDFVDELAEWTTGVPLLVVCTARPELLTRRPHWGGGKLNASTIALESLSDDETARLMADLLDRPVLPAEVQRTLLDQAGGNPLYAEQFAQLYLERRQQQQVPLPETLQGIIAARLDGLSAEEKTLLRNAAVVGKVFWTRSLGADGRDAEAVLHSLERKGFVRRQRRSSVGGVRAARVPPRSRSETSPTARSRAASGLRCTAESRNGSSHLAGLRITQRCSRTTGRRRSSSNAPPEDMRQRSSCELEQHYAMQAIAPSPSARSIRRAVLPRGAGVADG